MVNLLEVPPKTRHNNWMKSLIPDQPPLPLGTKIDDGMGAPWEIQTILLTGGERYYLLDGGGRGVALWDDYTVRGMLDLA